MLDLSFQLLGGSELRLHAYPGAAGARDARAIPHVPWPYLPRDEVTYVWAAGPNDVAMRTVYGREMPAHCACTFSPAQATRRLSCLKLGRESVGGRSPGRIERLGPVEPGGPHRLCCTCAPVHDYTGREVARVGLFAHQADDGALDGEYQQACRELARQISVRLGHLPAAFMSVTA